MPKENKAKEKRKAKVAQKLRHLNKDLPRGIRKQARASEKKRHKETEKGIENRTKRRK